MNDQTLLKTLKEAPVKRKKYVSAKLLLLTPDGIKPRDYFRQKLIAVMPYHIGKEKSITPYDLFKEIYEKDPYEMNVWQRMGMWQIVKSVMSKLRAEGILFTINEGKCLYVLKSKEECKAFHERTDARIKGLHHLKKTATLWVNKKAWKQLAYND